MKSRRIIMFFVLGCASFAHTTSFFEFLSQPKKEEWMFPQRQIHNAIFDLYFPSSAQMTFVEKTRRLLWRAQLWYYLRTRPTIVALLNLLQPSSPLLPAEIKREFSDIIANGVANTNQERLRHLQYTLRRHPNEKVRKFAATIRKMYTYLAYSSPLTSAIAGYNNQAVKEERGITLMPRTKLRRAGDNIIHPSGEIDYLIIGSGPAGSLIAHDLVTNKKGCRVVLIDAGSLVKPHSIATESRSEFMEADNQRTTVDGGIIIRNGHAFGGGTIVNIDLAFSPLLPVIQHRLAHWIENERLDSALVHENSGDWRHLHDAYSYVTRMVGTRTVDVGEINENNRILFRGTPTATTYDLNARRPKDVDDKNVKISALDAFIVPALAHGLCILPDVKVKRLLFDTSTTQTRVAGVEIEFQTPINKTYTITDPNQLRASAGETAILHAKNIIICAGTLGSAEILLRSGINNSNIGKGIVIHPSMGIYGKFPKEIDALCGLPASVYAAAPKLEDGYFLESMTADPAFVALITPGSGTQILNIVRNAKYLAGFGVLLVDSVQPNNIISIDPHTDQVQVTYTLCDADKERFKKGIAHGLEILFDQGCSEAHIPSCEPILATDEEYHPLTAKEQINDAMKKLQFIENENFLSCAHMQSSNKMGKDPRSAVVSLNFKVWDQGDNREIENLYVCDSSIFPTSVGANPMQSVYTFAKLFVNQHLLAT